MPSRQLWFGGDGVRTLLKALEALEDFFRGAFMTPLKLTCLEDDISKIGMFNYIPRSLKRTFSLCLAEVTRCLPLGKGLNLVLILGDFIVITLSAKGNITIFER